MVDVQDCNTYTNSALRNENEVRLSGTELATESGLSYRGVYSR